MYFSVQMHDDRRPELGGGRTKWKRRLLGSPLVGEDHANAPALGQLRRHVAAQELLGRARSVLVAIELATVQELAQRGDALDAAEGVVATVEAGDHGVDHGVGELTLQSVADDGTRIVDVLLLFALCQHTTHEHLAPGAVVVFEHYDVLGAVRVDQRRDLLLDDAPTEDLVRGHARHDPRQAWTTVVKPSRFRAEASRLLQVSTDIAAHNVSIPGALQSRLDTSQDQDLGSAREREAFAPTVWDQLVGPADAQRQAQETRQLHLVLLMLLTTWRSQRQNTISKQPVCQDALFTNSI